MWGPAAHKNSLSRLIHLHNCGIRLACGLCKYGHVSQHRARLPVESFVKYCSLIILFQDYYVGRGGFTWSCISVWSYSLLWNYRCPALYITYILHLIIIIIINCFSVLQNSYELKTMNWLKDFWSTDGLQQLVLTAFKYPNLTETINGPKKGKNIPPPPGLEPQATRFPVKRHTWCSSRRDGYVFISFEKII